MSDVKTAQTFARMMKKEGIQSLKCGDIEIHLSPYAVITKTKATSKNKSAPDHIPTEGFTDEQILNWSAPSVGLDG